MTAHSKSNEWSSLKDNFHALMRRDPLTRRDSESIEDAFDAEFRRRLGELINRATERKKRTGAKIYSKKNTNY
jgi:hypothetical protein